MQKSSELPNIQFVIYIAQNLHKIIVHCCFGCIIHVNIIIENSLKSMQMTKSDILIYRVFVREDANIIISLLLMLKISLVYSFHLSEHVLNRNRKK